MTNKKPLSEKSWYCNECGVREIEVKDVAEAVSELKQRVDWFFDDDDIIDKHLRHSMKLLIDKIFGQFSNNNQSQEDVGSDPMATKVLGVSSKSMKDIPDKSEDSKSSILSVSSGTQICENCGKLKEDHLCSLNTTGYICSWKKPIKKFKPKAQKGVSK